MITLVVLHSGVGLRSRRVTAGMKKNDRPAVLVALWCFGLQQRVFGSAFSAVKLQPIEGSTII